MAVRTNIEAEAWGDLRFATLARYLGLAQPKFALILCAEIWSWQTENYTPENPTYVVDRELIETVLGEGGAEKFVRAKLGEDHPDGIRVKGSVGRVEWLYRTTQGGKKGGRPKCGPTYTSAPQIGSEDYKQEPRGYPPGVPQGHPGSNPLSSSFLVREELSISSTPQVEIPGVAEPLPPEPPESPKPRKAREPTSDHARAIAAFDEQFTIANGARPTWGATEGKLIRGLLRRAPVDEVVRRMRIMFHDPPPWPPPPHDLKTFVAHFDRFVNPSPRSTGRLAIDRPAPAPEKLS